MTDPKAQLQQQILTVETEANKMLQMISTLMANCTTSQIEDIVMPMMQDYKLMKLCIKTSKEKAAEYEQR